MMLKKRSGVGSCGVIAVDINHSFSKYAQLKSTI